MTKIDPLRSLRPVAEEALAELVDRAIVPSGRPLAYDVYASNHELIIEFDVPGITAEHVRVEVEDRTLVVSATRELRARAGVDVIESGRQHGRRVDVRAATPVMPSTADVSIDDAA